MIIEVTETKYTCPICKGVIEKIRGFKFTGFICRECGDGFDATNEVELEKIIGKMGNDK